MNDVQVTSRSGVGPDAIEPAVPLAPWRTPVLLLPGFLATPRTLGPLAHRLRADGFDVFTVEVGGLAGRFHTGRIDALAEAVRDEVERIYARHPGMPRLVVIGHSQGGLIASWWVKRLGGDRRVRAVVTLGTPHRGTRLAWAGVALAWLMPAIAQMLPGSRFLRRLHEGAWPARVALLSFCSRRDRVAPWPSTVVEPQGTAIRNVEVDGGHFDYLLRKTIYRTIVGELRLAARREARPARAPTADTTVAA